jgi:hypothetical protein
MKNPKSVNFFNEKLNFNFFYDKITGFFLKLGPRAARLLNLRARAGRSRSFLKLRAGTGSGRPNVTGSSPLISTYVHILLTLLSHLLLGWKGREETQGCAEVRGQLAFLIFRSELESGRDSERLELGASESELELESKLKFLDTMRSRHWNLFLQALVLLTHASIVLCG